LLSFFLPFLLPPSLFLIPFLPSFFLPSFLHYFLPYFVPSFCPSSLPSFISPPLSSLVPSSFYVFPGRPDSLDLLDLDISRDIARLGGSGFQN
jgi:hypothetical protein